MDEAKLAELIAAAIAPLAAKVEAIGKTATEAAAKATADKAAADKAAADKVAEEKAAADKAAADKGKGISPEVNSQLLDMQKSNKALQERLEAMEKARKDAEERAITADTNSKVASALNGFEFHSDNARQDAQKAIIENLTRNEHGELVSKDNLTYDTFIKSFIPEQKAYLLKPENASGSGVTAGTSRVGGKAVGMETIRQGMSAEETMAVAAQIRNALSQQ